MIAKETATIFLISKARWKGLNSPVLEFLSDMSSEQCATAIVPM
jgi:hypothetical protein